MKAGEIRKRRYEIEEREEPQHRKRNITSPPPATMPLYRLQSNVRRETSSRNRISNFAAPRNEREAKIFYLVEMKIEIDEEKHTVISRSENIEM